MVAKRAAAERRDALLQPASGPTSRPTVPGLVDASFPHVLLINWNRAGGKSGKARRLQIVIYQAVKRLVQPFVIQTAVGSTAEVSISPEMP